jgi:dipeptide/tripeptide permease
MSTTTTDAHLNKIFFGHPIGLFIIFTEMWERFHIMG